MSRCCVEVDLLSDLPSRGQNKHGLFFKYENLSKYCKLCNHQVHDESKCRLLNTYSKQNQNPKLKPTDKKAIDLQRHLDLIIRIQVIWIRERNSKILRLAIQQVISTQSSTRSYRMTHIVGKKIFLLLRFLLSYF